MCKKKKSENKYFDIAQASTVSGFDMAQMGTMAGAPCFFIDEDVAHAATSDTSILNIGKETSKIVMPKIVVNLQLDCWKRAKIYRYL